MADISHAYAMEPIVTFNLSRTQADKIDHVYSLIEKLKNGVMFSPEYDSGTKIFRPSHVIVFANFLPDERHRSGPREGWGPGLPTTVGIAKTCSATEILQAVAYLAREVIGTTTRVVVRSGFHFHDGQGLLDKLIGLNAWCKVTVLRLKSCGLGAPSWTSHERTL